MLHIFATLYEKKYTKALATAPFENILFQNQSIKQTKYSEKQRRHPEKHLEKVSLTVSIIYFILLIMIKNWSKLQKFKSCTFVQICFKILGSCNLLQRNRSKQVKQKKYCIRVQSDEDYSALWYERVLNIFWKTA